MSQTPEPHHPPTPPGLLIPAAWRAMAIAGEAGWRALPAVSVLEPARPDPPDRDADAVRVPVPRFWEAREYAGLPAEVKAAFGQAALAWVAATEGADAARDEVEERPYLAAAEAARERVLALFDAHVLGDCGPPGVPALLGRVCVVCGCSERDGSGGWARPDLCVACADGAEVAPRARKLAGNAR